MYACLSNSIARWMVPHTKVTRDKEMSLLDKTKKSLAHHCTKLNRKSSLTAAIVLILGINAILFITRSLEYKDMYMLKPWDKNVFYMIARGSGKFRTMLALPKYTEIYPYMYKY